MNIYAVCYRPFIVRDAQVFKGDPDLSDPLSDGWEDVLDCEIYVGLFMAETEDAAIRMAAESESCHEGCLVAHQVPVE